jgi:hypothetical protein
LATAGLKNVPLNLYKNLNKRNITLYIVCSLHAMKIDTRVYLEVTFGIVNVLGRRKIIDDMTALVAVRTEGCARQAALLRGVICSMNY